MPTAFAFDLDETLVDCERQHEAATAAMLDALDLPRAVARDAFHDVTGKRTRDILETFRASSGVSHSLDELLALRHSAFLAALDAEPPQPLPGAAELLAACKRVGPVALVTSGYRDDALESARAAGLLVHFDAVVTGEDVVEPKPAAEPYRVAASRLGARPADVLAFEDSARGVTSARSAGCRVVAVPKVKNTPLASVAHADVVLSSMLEALPLDAFLARLP